MLSNPSLCVHCRKRSSKPKHWDLEPRKFYCGAKQGKQICSKDQNSLMVFREEFLLFCFVLFFYFTMLYWFCHTSPCICHRYTRVPHPESSKIFLVKESALSFSLLSMMLTVGLSYMAFFTKLKQKKFNLYEIAKAILRKKTELEG